MSFALTKYLFPLENRITLSNHCGYCFDNPRNDSEILLIRKFISKTLTRPETNSTSMSLIGRTSYSLDDLKEWQLENESTEYSTQYLVQHQQLDTIEYLCKIWIIIRFEDDETFNTLQESSEGLVHTLLSRSENQYEAKFNRMVAYCHLLSLLGHKNEEFFGKTYHGTSFLLNSSPYEIFFTSYSETVYDSVEHFEGFNSLLKSPNRVNSWLFWQDGSAKIITQAHALETLLTQPAIHEQGAKIRISQKQTPEEKVFHVGYLLKTSYEHLSDPKLMLLILVSVIEYLLTRNPDSNRYNIEESITKQFVLKCGTIIHSQNNTLNMQDVNKKLKLIYNLRSDIAHGNYDANTNIREIAKLVVDLYEYLNYIIKELVKDRCIVEYLKDN